MSDFVSRLVSLRRNRSKAEFARVLGIAPQVYQRYEDGRIPSPEMLSRTAQGLRIILLSILASTLYAVLYFFALSVFLSRTIP